MARDLIDVKGEEERKGGRGGGRDRWPTSVVCEAVTTACLSLTPFPPSFPPSPPSLDRSAQGKHHADKQLCGLCPGAGREGGREGGMEGGMEGREVKR